MSSAETRGGFDLDNPGCGLALAAVAAVAIVAVANGADLWDRARDVTHDDSLIVRTVPGQVEGHNVTPYVQKYFTTWIYHLGIEQCPQDIADVRSDGVFNGPPHYDTRLGVRNSACNFDWVQVSRGNYEKFADGSVITFGGDIGEPLEKVG